MKGRLILLILIFHFPCYIWGQYEREIFAQVLQDFPLENSYNNLTHLILRRPEHKILLKETDYPRFKRKCRQLNSHTFEEFVKKAGNELTFDSLLVQRTPFIVLHTEYEEIKRDLASIYPDWNGIYVIELSPIGFNETKTQAMIYYGYFGYYGGGGIYLIYKRKKKKWKRVCLIPAWAS